MNSNSTWLCVALMAMSLQISRGADPDVQPVRTFESVHVEVDALTKEDVNWRKIEWKTCLLDGLRASREQHKPIMLWIFIDRPIDDERC
ncbi:MAG: hypothetical protein VB878_09260 [Pirellulaceae bacterium]